MGIAVAGVRPAVAPKGIAPGSRPGLYKSNKGTYAILPSSSGKTKRGVAGAADSVLVLNSSKTGKSFVTPLSKLKDTYEFVAPEGSFNIATEAVKNF